MYNYTMAISGAYAGFLKGEANFEILSQVVARGVWGHAPPPQEIFLKWCNFINLLKH